MASMTPTPLSADTDHRWKVLQGMKLAGVRSAVSSSSLATLDQQFELQRVLGNMQDTDLLVYFVLGTQSLTVTREGASTLIRALAAIFLSPHSLKALVYFVIPAPDGWTGEAWTSTIDQQDNARLVALWTQWVGEVAADSHFVFTTYSPQQLLFESLQSRGIKSVMVNSMGCGSLNDAVDSLIPVVGVPYGADMPWNSLAMQDMGAGINRSEIIDEMKAAGTFLPPGTWIGPVHTSIAVPVFGPANLVSNGYKEQDNRGETLADAIVEIFANYEGYQTAMQHVKQTRDDNTFSQEEVTEQLVHMARYDLAIPRL